MPTLSQLQYIVALHRTGHFGRAAVECNISQPTLSALVAKAEDELGATLFDRRTKPVIATPRGRELIALAQEVLHAHARLLAAAASQGVLSGAVTLGVIPTLAPYILPWFLGPFARQYPNIALTIHERTTEGILDDMRALRMDAALVATPLGESSLSGRVLFYDPFYVYAHPESQLLALDEVTSAEVDREDLWLLEDGHCFRTQVVGLCGRRARGALGTVRFEAGSFETLRALIDHVGGFTLIPESFARTLPVDVRVRCVRPFCDPIPSREVSLVSHRAHARGDIMDVIAESLRTLAPRSLPRTPAHANVLPIDQ